MRRADGLLPFLEEETEAAKSIECYQGPSHSVVFQSAGLPSTKPQILTLKHPWGTGAPFVANSMWCGRSRVL